MSHESHHDPATHRRAKAGLMTSDPSLRCGQRATHSHAHKHTHTQSHTHQGKHQMRPDEIMQLERPGGQSTNTMMRSADV